MLLTIDVGNTGTAIGIFKKNKLIKRYWIETGEIKGIGGLRGIKGIGGVERVIISSVVPSADKVLRKIFNKTFFVSSKNIPIKIKVKNPNEVGADRLVNAYATYKLYGAPAIVVDFGTATTFDILSKQGEYLGGAIASGIGITRDALHRRTAKLPLVDLKIPRSVIGKNTVESMHSGLVFGYAEMVDGMVRRFKLKLGTKTRVIATGGYAKIIKKVARSIEIVDEDLTLKGLALIGRLIDREACD